MPDMNNIAKLSLNALQNHNFDNSNLIKAGDVKRLLNEEGVFSIDDSGKLVVINPSKKLDNFFFRFVGGFFSSSYKNEQNTLERAFVLKKNASFNKLLRENIIRQKTESMSNSVHKTDNLRVLTDRINKLFTDPEQVTTNKIKEISSSNRAIHLRLGPIAEATMMTSDVGSGIMIKGESLSPFEFIKKYADTEGVKLDSRTLATSIMLRACRYTESFAAIGKENEANTIRELMSKSTLNDDQVFRFKDALSSIMSEVKTRMVNAVETALVQGKDIKAIANHIMSSVVVLSEKFNPDDFIQNTLLEDVFIKIDAHGALADAQDPLEYTKIDDEAVSRVTEKLKQELPGLTDKQLAKIVNHHRHNEFKDSKLNKYIDTIKKGYTEFKENIRELNEAISSKNTRAVSDLAYKFTQQVRAIVGNEIDGKDTISDVFSALIHYMSVKEDANFLSQFDFSKLSHFYMEIQHYLDGVKRNEADDEHWVDNKLISLTTVNVLLEQLGALMRPALEHGINGIDEHLENEELKSQAQALIKHFDILSSLDKPEVQELFEVGLEFFPEGARKNVKAYLKNILRAEAVKCDSVEEFEGKIKDLVKKYCNELLSNQTAVNLMDESGYSKEKV